MQKTTKDTSSRMPEGESGLQKREALKPWDIAGKSFRSGSGQVVSVAEASDVDFDQFVKRHGIPVDDNGIAGWSFDDRCRTINHGLRYGVIWQFVEEENNSETIPDSELFEEAPPASEAV